MVAYQGRCWFGLGLVLGTLGWAGLTGTCDAQTKVARVRLKATDPVERAFAFHPSDGTSRLAGR